MLIFPCWYITKFNSSTRNSAYSYYSVSSSGGNYWYCQNECRMCLQDNGKKILWEYDNSAGGQFNEANIIYYYMGF